MGKRKKEKSKKGHLFAELVAALVPKETSMGTLQRPPESNCLTFFFMLANCSVQLVLFKGLALRS